MDSDFWSSRIAAAKRQFTYSQRNNITVFDRLSFNDYEQQQQFEELQEDVEEVEIRQDFPCPYCYEDFDIVSLCSHIEDEHSTESRVAACPVCLVKLTSDMITHITLQHGQLFKISFEFKHYHFYIFYFCVHCKCYIIRIFSLTKNHLHRRRRLRKLAVPNNHTLSVLGRDLREAHLQVLLGGAGNGYRQSNTSTNTSSAPATDPFLSSLIMNFPTPEVEDMSKAVISSVDESSSKVPDQPRLWKISLDPSLTYDERQKRIKQAVGRAEFMQDLFLSTLLQD